MYTDKEFNNGYKGYYAECLRPEDLCITNEQINKSIRESKDIEWKSQKNFLDYIEKNSDCMDWKVIGIVSIETLKKWGKDPEIKDTLHRKYGIETFWVLCRGREYWYVSAFIKTKWSL